MEGSQPHPTCKRLADAPGRHTDQEPGPRSSDGIGPARSPDIESNLLSDPDDLKVLVAVVELCREIGHSAALRPFLKREVVPGNIKGPALESYLRGTAIS